MSWSEDTRCLYCEGRLPLYRKITHGQFCSSAHRKAYWQEHERLAIERLQQAHSSFRPYPSATQQKDLQEALEGSRAQEQSPGAIGIASHPELEMSPELRPVPALFSDPHVDVAPLETGEFLSLLAPDFVGLASSPELVAADPFEYEVTIPLLHPSHTSIFRTSPLREGLPVAAWSYLGPPASTAAKIAASAGIAQECQVEFCHPQSQAPAVRMRAAGRLKLPLAKIVDAAAAARNESSLQFLGMEPAPAIHVALDVPLQSDELVALLDQQVPRPDRLLALSQFAAHQPALALLGHAGQHLDATPDTILPFGAAPVVLADCHLVPAAKLVPLSGSVEPAQGEALRRPAFPEIPVNLLAGVSGATMRVVETVHHMGMAGLQSLRSTMSAPIQGALATQESADSQAFDFSTGVSSDVIYPSLLPVATASEAPLLNRILPLTFAKKRRADAPHIEPIVRLLPQAVEIQPQFPSSGLEPLDRKPAEDALRQSGSGIGWKLRGEGLGKLEPAWAHATGFWHHAPRDLKLLLFAIPALLALVFHPWPRVAFAAPQSSTSVTGSLRNAFNTQWVNVRQSLENRAAVSLDEDFRSGLDNWASPGGSTTEWSFDATGFVRPGPLALYRPSVNLADYQLQFLGLIDKKALSWVVRAADFENFYVVKLQIVKSGPLPAIGLTRYAVINGKSVDRHDVNIPLDARTDTVYRVRMDVQGSEFTVDVQGQIADSWTETRLPRGGVGFFTAGGEASRVRWMQITHQYDMLGRLCAYLAPYDTTNGSWQP